MASIPFTKMQGAGNDFIVVNNMELGIPVEKFPAIARTVCAHRLSLGGDALMVADAPEHGGHVRMRFYNADGSEGEMCGNGARCLARYAYETGLAGEEIHMETVAGDVFGWRLSKREYRIRLNKPEVMKLNDPVEVDGVTYDCSYVELGNPGLPHAVVHLPGLEGKQLDELRPLGAALRSHPAFPKGANVNFWELLSDGRVCLRTFERGVEDFTLACGTGSGSTAAALTLRGIVPAGERVRLTMPGGELGVDVECGQDGVAALYLMGDTNRVAEGVITDENLEI